MFKLSVKRVFTVIALAAIAGVGALLLTMNGVFPGARADDTHHAETQTLRMATTSGPMSHGAAGTPMPGMNMQQEFDLMFIDMMIPHHEGAIAMAEVALEKGEHQEIKDLAKAIIESQQAEIDQMMAWRDEWYPNAPTMPMDQMAQMMGGMMQMPSMMATPAMGMMDMTTMLGHMGDATMDAEALHHATGPFDKAFIEMMLSSSPERGGDGPGGAAACGSSRDPGIGAGNRRCAGKRNRSDAIMAD